MGGRKSHDEPTAAKDLRGNEIIAQELAKLGLDAKAIDGWVYVALPDGRLLYIGAEYGQSLLAEFFPSQPTWFTEAESDA